MVKNAIIDIGFIESSCDEPDLYKAIGDDQLVVISSDPNLSRELFSLMSCFIKNGFYEKRLRYTRGFFRSFRRDC